MISNKTLSQLMLLSVVAGPLTALAAPSYTVAFAPAGFSIPTASGSLLNNRGQILGSVNEIPAIWQGARATPIPALAGHSASGINNRGDIVGSSVNGPFLYTASGMHYLSITAPYETNYGKAVNDAREVIGLTSEPGDEAARGFMLTRGRTQLIGTFGGAYSDATSLNNAGYVVGHSGINNPYRMGDARAFVYKNGVMRNLGALGGAASAAWDINDAGQVVGYAELPIPSGAPRDEFDYGEFHAFLYYRGTMRDLGTLGGTESRASAINQDGVVVGRSTLAGDRQMVAFVYQQRKMRDLNTLVRLAPGWTLESATDINDKGQILARACYQDECRYWARLTPLRKARHASGEAGEALAEAAGGDDQQ